MALIAPQLQSRPLQSLILIFTAWKGFLLAIALAATVSPPYDTSTDLLFHRLSSNSNSSAAPLLARQLTRWDALYFIHASQGAGKRYEQEFAFGSGLSSLLHALSSLFPSQDAASSSALLGVFVAHVTHLASVLILYRLTHLVFPQSKHLAFTASVLHVISPAGLFLSSPYAESPFSCLSFGGSYLFAISCMSPCRTRRALLVIAAGGAFGLGTWFRSNGLASGLLFAVATLQSLGALLRAPSLSSLLEVLGPLVGGMLVAAGSAIPQFLAWQRFCHSADPRPWCEKMIPSIYNFVQEHYWSVAPSYPSLLG